MTSNLLISFIAADDVVESTGSKSLSFKFTLDGTKKSKACVAVTYFSKTKKPINFSLRNKIDNQVEQFNLNVRRSSI